MRARVVVADVGQKLVHDLVPPSEPRRWKINERGQPEWLLDSDLPEAPWAQLLPAADEAPAEYLAARSRDARDQGARTWPSRAEAPWLETLRRIGPAAMPAISWSTPHTQKPGRPRLQHAAPELARAAAWLADVRQASRREIAIRLNLAPGAIDDRNVRRKVARHVQEGRLALADQGVLPWMCFEDEDGRWNGESLPSRWWESHRFLDDLDCWQDVSCQIGARA